MSANSGCQESPAPRDVVRRVLLAVITVAGDALVGGQYMSGVKSPMAARGAASSQEKLVGTYGEARTSLAFKMPDATVQELLPSGWLSSPFSAGPAKDANLTVTFMDWLVAQDSDGKPAATYRNVGLSVPARQNGTELIVTVAVVGLSSPPGYAPGPYGNFSAAKGIMSRTLRINDEGRSRAEESWDFEGETGDSIRLEIQFVRGIAVRRNAEVRVHSAIKPKFYRIYRTEEAVDVVRSGTERSDRVQRCFFKASGPRLSPLFNGSEQLISIASLPWVSRRVFVPITGVR